IKEAKIGTASATAWEGRIPAAFYCTLTPMGDHTIEEMEKAVYSEIDKLRTEPVSEWELEKVRNQMKASLLRGLNSNGGLAFRISTSEALTGDWGHFIKAYEAISKVTAEDVMRVANKYLTKENRTVATLVKAGTGNESEISKSGY
ncbi:MAG: insulinase family protein, partial [Candidatus Zixiibacteriota bacterium]